MRLDVFSERESVVLDRGQDYNGSLRIAGYGTGFGKPVEMTSLDITVFTANGVSATNRTSSSGFVSLESTVTAVISAGSTGVRFTPTTVDIQDNAFEPMAADEQVVISTRATDTETISVRGGRTERLLEDGFTINIDVDVFTGIGSTFLIPVMTNPFSNNLYASVSSVATYSVEARNFSNRADDVTGTSSSDVVSLRDGKDVFNGRGGSDAAAGGAGADKLIGGGGRDNLRGGEGKDVLRGQAADDLLFGGDQNDTAYGGAGDDRLFGGNNNDRLLGDDDDDLLSGNNGGDFIFGGNGADTLTGGKGYDKLSGGNGADDLAGNKGQDSLLGGSGRDTLDGGIGDDVMSGGTQADTFILRVGDGDDIIKGFTGSDNFVVEQALVAAFDTAEVVNGDIVITFDDDQSVTLNNFTRLDILPEVVSVLVG